MITVSLSRAAWGRWDCCCSSREEKEGKKGNTAALVCATNLRQEGVSSVLCQGDFQRSHPEHRPSQPLLCAWRAGHILARHIVVLGCRFPSLDAGFVSLDKYMGQNNKNNPPFSH